MIEGHLERLHAAHRQPGHGAMIAIRQRPEMRINKWNQCLCHIVFKGRRHLLHRLHHLRRAEGFPGQIGIGMAGALCIAVGHHDDHRLRASTGDQVVEDEVGMPLPDPASLIFAAAVLKIQHGIPRLRLRVVARRRIDEGVPPTPGDL